MGVKGPRPERTKGNLGDVFCVLVFAAVFLLFLRAAYAAVTGQ